MALQQQKVLNSVELLQTVKCINVRWENQIIDDTDNSVISSKYERKAYTESQKVDFLAEVTNAQQYVDAIGWA